MYVSNPWNAELSSHHCTKVLKDATLFFSCLMPNFAIVIPAMDFINDKLMAHAYDQSLSPAIKASLKLRMKIMNHYYSLTDLLEVYHIIMGMWPMFSFASSSHSMPISFTPML